MKLMQGPRSLLARMGWKAKIYAFAGLLTAGTVVVSAVGGVAILQLNASVEEAVGKARERAAVAADSRIWIISVDRALARLVSAQDAGDIRREAVAAIRAASMLDESLQALEKKLGGSRVVEELVQLNAEVSSSRMVIIKAAKARETDKAAEESKAIAEKIARIEELSGQIFFNEQSTLSKSVEEAVAFGQKVILVLGVFVAGCILIAAGLGIVFARELARSISAIQVTIGSNASGRRGSDMHDDGEGRDLALAAHAVHVSAIAGDLSGCGERMAEAVGHIKSGTLHVRNATDESGKQLDSAVMQIQKMADSVAANATSIANIVCQFEVMKNELQDAIGVTQTLQRSVGNISAIANSISAISSQTNLLALNAAIEAARAGTHGRGFAVVANEVRSLAGRTSEATREIHAIANGIDSNVSKAVASLDQSARNACQYSEQLNQILESSSASAQDTSHARQMMDAVLSQMNVQREAVGMIQEQLAEVELTTALNQEQSASLRGVSDALSGSAEQLAELAEKLKL